MMMKEKRDVSDDDYLKKECVGSGTYGVVWRALEKGTGQEVAIKKMKIECAEEGVQGVAIREVSLLLELDHENVIKLKKVLGSGWADVFLIFEYVRSDLKKLLKALSTLKMSGGALSGELLRSYTRQIFAGLAHCHGRRIIHRDLKPQNILIDNTGVLKLADFGLARALDAASALQLTHEVVTLWYRPPEVLMGAQNGQLYDFGVDVWSAACVVAEMSTGRALFPGDCEIDTLFRIFKILGTPIVNEWPGLAENRWPQWKPCFPQWTVKPADTLANICPNMDPLGIDLLCRCFIYNPAKRLTAEQALSHPYFENVFKFDANREVEKTLNCVFRQMDNDRSKKENQLRAQGGR